jgi:hypothetical protein
VTVPPPPPTRLDLRPPVEVIEVVESAPISVVKRAPSVSDTDLDIIVLEEKRQPS